MLRVYLRVPFADFILFTFMLCGETTLGGLRFSCFSRREGTTSKMAKATRADGETGYLPVPREFLLKNPGEKKVS